MDNLIKRLCGLPLNCECGHKTKLKKIIKVGNESAELKVKYRPFGKIPYCLDCVEKMTVTCPWCGRPIFVRDYVTLYSPSDPNFKIPKGTVVYSKNPLQLVSCQRSDCADTGADYCGYWDVPGKVRRFSSAIERVRQTGEPVIINF